MDQQQKSATGAHTPGPWTGKDRGVDVLVRGAGDAFVCRVSHKDAPIIAAAPQLAEALRGLMSEMERGFLVMPDELAQEYRNDIRALVERADAALAAAGIAQ